MESITPQSEDMPYIPETPTLLDGTAVENTASNDTHQKNSSQQPLIQWKASEFIDHQKGASWFIPLVAGALILSMGLFFLTHDILTSLVILLGAGAFGVYARQKPRTLTYSLLPTTLKIGQKSYSYDDFRTFSVMQDGALFSVLLEPVRRLMPPLTIYFAKEDGERIFDALSAHIPHLERQLDPIDRLMRKIRF